MCRNGNKRKCKRRRNTGMDPEGNSEKGTGKRNTD